MAKHDKTIRALQQAFPEHKLRREETEMAMLFIVQHQGTRHALRLRDADTSRDAEAKANAFLVQLGAQHVDVEPMVADPEADTVVNAPFVA